MICEICKKNPASIHIQEIIGGEKKNLHICAECASDKNLDESVLNGFNLAEILYNLSSQMLDQEPLANAGQKESSQEDSGHGMVAVRCPECGMDSARFRARGRLGCGKCYEVFHEILSRAIKSMHRGVFHLGKHPGSRDLNTNRILNEIMHLQKELEECVMREEFERAAELRDKISALRKQSKARKKENADGGIAS